MTAPRLELALSEGGLPLPGDGLIAVFGPRAGDDLGALPKDRVVVITGFAPDYAAFQSAGYACAVAPEGRFCMSLVFVARAKKLAQALIAQAASVTDGVVVVDGAKTDGIDSMLKSCRQRGDVTGPVNKAHGKLFWFQGGDFSDWASAGPARLPDGWVTAPGVFSADGVDPASALLASVLPAKIGARVADLGAGWGYLSARLLERDTIRQVDLVEADHSALECARVNVGDPRAKFHWADATTWRPDTLFDAVVSNPPFHHSRAADPGIGQGFIRAAGRMLRPGGRLWIVANRHLPYETVMADVFGKVEEVGGDSRFKVLLAVRSSRHPR